MMFKYAFLLRAVPGKTYIVFFFRKLKSAFFPQKIKNTLIIPFTVIIHQKKGNFIVQNKQFSPSLMDSGRVLHENKPGKFIHLI